MPINFHETASAVHIVDMDIDKNLDHLPAGVYRCMVTHNPMGTSYLMEKRVKTFQLPERKFGDHHVIVNAVVEHYDKVNPAFGLLACGLKGAGKSLLCEDIGNHLIKAGLPVLIIDTPIAQCDLRFVIAAIGPCVLYFDEFGKIYTEDRQRDDLLTLFSDSSLRGVVFLATGNRIEEFSHYLLNRPGRFRFLIDMAQLGDAAVHEYLESCHVGKEKAHWLSTISSMLTYDILSVMAPAMRSSDTFEEFRRAIRYLNVPTPYPTRITLYTAELKGASVGRVISVDFIEDNIQVVVEVTLPNENGSSETKIVTGTFRCFDDGRFLIKDRKAVADGELECSFDIGSYYGPSSMLLPGKALYKNIQKYGTTETKAVKMGSNLPKESAPAEANGRANEWVDPSGRINAVDCVKQLR